MGPNPRLPARADRRVTMARLSWRRWSLAAAAAFACLTAAAAKADAPRVADNEACAPGSACPAMLKLEAASDWPGLEALANKTLASLPSTPDGEALGTQYELFLGEALWREKRYPEAEAVLKRSLDSRLRGVGQNEPMTIRVDRWLVGLESDWGHPDAAFPYLNAAIGGYNAALKTADPKTAALLKRYEAGAFLDGGAIREAQENYDKALDDFTNALNLQVEVAGVLDPDAYEAATAIADILLREDRADEGAAFLNDFITRRDAATSPSNPDTNRLVASRGELLLMDDRFPEAEHDLARAIGVLCRAPISVKTCPPILLQDDSLALTRTDKLPLAAERMRQTLALHQQLVGPVSLEIATDHEDIAEVLMDEADYAGAEHEYAQAQDVLTRISGPKSPSLILFLTNHAKALQELKRIDEAAALLERARDILATDPDPGANKAALVHEALGVIEGSRGLYEKAVSDWRAACAVRENSVAFVQQRGLFVAPTRRDESDCNYGLDLALWDWAAHGGGTAITDKPDALDREAFAAAQNVDLSAAGDAVAASASIAVATRAGVGQLADDYEATLRARDAAQDALLQEGLPEGQRAHLTADRDAATAKLSDLAMQLRQKSPQFWNYRSPQPVTVEALQASSGPDAALLHGDEAVILFLDEETDAPGFVFAISKDRAGWARLGVTHDQLEAKVAHLRCQVDLQEDGSAGQTQTGGVCAGTRQGAFDRAAAHDLYQALLGAPAIQSVIGPKHVLLFVPSGPLISLPPGLLVTSPPQGGVAGDSDPKALRATPWLLRTKAVALLPTVNALRALRQLAPGLRTATSDPLLAFADPDFGVTSPAPNDALGQTLASLPALTWTRLEGQSLQSALNAPADSLLLGAAASKAALMDRNNDGRLARVRVLEFATHGLMAPLHGGQAEPALAMAAGPKPLDGVLLASEAATLKLNAEWVLLSACNTADPDAPEAQGLSGLSRAFFFAGARSLLVSHWRVRDYVAAMLVPEVLRGGSAGLGRAEALRRASLKVLDDPGLNAAHPAAWAPFTLIGEAGS